MEPANDHIIRSFVMDLHVEHREEANGIQERISRICRELIIPALSKICDRLMQNGEHLKLDKVEIDIGTIVKDELEEQLPRLLLQQLEEQVRQKVLHNGTSVVLPGETADHEKQDRTKTEVLLHYFRYGSLPWWNPYDKTDIELWVNQQIRDDDDIFWTYLEKHVQKPAVRKRVIHHLNDDQFYAWLAKKSSADVWPLYEVLQKSMIPDESISLPPKNLRIIFYDVLLRHLGRDDSSGIDRSKLTKEQKQSVVLHILRRLKKAHSVAEDFFPKLRQKITSATSLFTAKEWNQMFKKVDPPTDLESEGADHSKNKPDSKEPIKENDQFIEVFNAGLVLLWPYLGNLFEHLDLAENERFIDEESTWKAVHLLHFIGTGPEEGSEHQWPLNKLLCGLSPDAFVSEEMELTSTEKQEARAMMEAAIGHWEALKNTSVSGFRETFLQHDGIITPDPNGWKVQVDRTAYDILLDRLPWTISIIKLPWSDNVIYVQW